MLEEIGLEPERLEMFNLSSAEGIRFAEIVAQMHERIVQLGPNPLRQNGADPFERFVGRDVEEAGKAGPGEIQ